MNSNLKSYNTKKTRWRLVAAVLSVAAVSVSYDLFKPNLSAGQSSTSNYLVEDFYTVHPADQPLQYFAALAAPPPFFFPDPNGGPDIGYHVGEALVLDSNVTVSDSGSVSIPSGVLGHMGPINTTCSWLIGVKVGSSSEVNGDVISQASLSLANNSFVDGDVETAFNAEVGSGVVVTGTLSDNTGGITNVKRPGLMIAFPEDAWTSVNVNSGQTQTISPGAYDKINVNGTLNFEAGYYYFNELTTGSSSTLNFPSSGNIVLNIKWRMLYNGSISNPASVAPRLAVFFRRGGPVQINGRWAGTLFAPNDIIEIKNVNAEHLGMFIGYQVKMQNNAEIKHVVLDDFETIFPGFDIHGEVHASNDTLRKWCHPLNEDWCCMPREAGVVSSTPPTVGGLLSNLDTFIDKLEDLESELE